MIDYVALSMAVVSLGINFISIEVAITNYRMLKKELERLKGEKND